MPPWHGLSQGEKEDERAFGLRVRDTARLCGKVFSENQLITRFILGSHADIKPVILSNKSLWGRVSFGRVCQKSPGSGRFTPALIGKRTRTVMPWLFGLKGRQPLTILPS